MATYELDDELVRKFISQQDSAGWGNEIADEVAATLERQLPIPVPVKVGAVVRAVGAFTPLNEAETFVRWALDSRTHSPWIVAGNHEQPYRTDEIGRITAVLSPGVDL